MKRGKWWPGSLQNRIFVAYIVLVLLPFSVICLFGFQRIENVLKQKQIEQNAREITDFRADLLDLMGLMTRSLILIEQNPAFEQYLDGDGRAAPETVRKEINRNLDSLANSFFLSTPSVYLTVTDTAGRAYFNYSPQEAVDGREWYEEIRGRIGRQKTAAAYAWLEADNYVAKDIVRSGKLLTLDALLYGEGPEPYGAARISIDHLAWLRQWAERAGGQAEYFVVQGGKNIVFRSREEGGVPPELALRLHETLRSRPDRPVAETSEREETLYLASYLKPLEWTVVKKISLHEVFAETNAIKRSVFLLIAALTLVFAAATLLISSTVTKPLRTLRRKMSEAADNELKVTIPTEPYSGEILHLLTGFNRMIADIQHLIYRLKAEERQKESVRFQILVSQMNPHFLLNTLNIVKSQALKNKDKVTFDICVSLGLLLESSLQVEIDLVTLEREIAFAEAYTHIQNVRFAGRYRLEFHYDGSLTYALVPKFTLQPLVENAILHGFADSPEGGTIRVGVRREGARLCLRVEDDGRGPAAAEAAAPFSRRRRKGIGLSNIRERLELLYKGDAEMELCAVPDGKGTIVEMRFPLLVSEPYREGGQRHV